MLNQQNRTNGNMATVSVAAAQLTDAETVDMTVLSSFEELQEVNETSLVVELIELYLHDASLKIDAIRQAVAQADKAAWKSAAHSLKGSSGTLGVRRLALISEDLECLADDGLSLAANGVLERLEQEFVRVKEVLTSELYRRLPQPAGV